MYLEAGHDLRTLDRCLLAVLPWLSAWILLSGIDDLIVDLLFLRRWLRGRESPPEPPPDGVKLAILIPAWQEHRVIERMLRHNLSAIRFADYAIFVGVYPNDELTADAVRRVAREDARVHLCVVPHDGPTSKADCLNWVLQHLFLDELYREAHFDGVVIHDAEDVIHPDGLTVIAEHLPGFGMVQVPVLPLATPFWHLTHAVYCDDFAESQTKDLLARQQGGGFLPSCGVGTGLSRAALQTLAETSANRILEPTALTEDYELGYRLHRLGFRQTFVELSVPGPIATREFFPHSFWGAVRQRTRWITGIALQGWQRNGWGTTFGEAYWFWRDRKCLIGNPLSVAANLLFFYGLATWIASLFHHHAWPLGGFIPWLAWSGAALQGIRLATRTAATARIYGAAFAAGTPLRLFWANWINFFATAGAVRRFFTSQWRRLPLVWLKTEHAFPTLSAIVESERRAQPKVRAARAGSK